MAQHDPLPDADDITRWIKPTLLAADDDGEIEVDDNGSPLFIYPQAFELRQDEEYLSVTWVQHFGPEKPENLKNAASAVRHSQRSKRLPSQGVFALAHVEAVRECCAQHGHKVRILEEPEDENSGHAAIRRYPHAMSELQEHLASQIFVERYFYRDLA